MSLRRSPIRTAALLAACRANAQKSTGPRTAAGKARTRLNSLRHGRYCRQLQRLLPEGLSLRNRFHYNWIQRTIENCFQPRTARDKERARKLAVQVWCEVAEAVGTGARSGNHAEKARVREKYPFLSPRFRIGLPHSKQSLTFWIQARGRRARLAVGEERRRAQGLFAGWYGYGRVEDWSGEPRPDPERDPMGFWHWQREMRRQFRAFQRAQAREARRAQEWKNLLDDLVLGQARSPRPSLPLRVHINSANRESGVATSMLCRVSQSGVNACYDRPSHGHLRGNRPVA